MAKKNRMKIKKVTKPAGEKDSWLKKSDEFAKKLKKFMDENFDSKAWIMIVFNSSDITEKERKYSVITEIHPNYQGQEIYFVLASMQAKSQKTMQQQQIQQQKKIIGGGKFGKRR